MFKRTLNISIDKHPVIPLYPIKALIYIGTSMGVGNGKQKHQLSNSANQNIDLIGSFRKLQMRAIFNSFT